MKNIGNDVIEYEKLCFEVVGNVSDFAATAHVTCMEKVHDHLLDNQKNFIDEYSISKSCNEKFYLILQRA